MYRLLIKSLVISALFSIILPGVAFAASIHFTTNSPLARTNTPNNIRKGGQGIKGCNIQVVQLHGTQPATMTCADQIPKAGTKGIMPAAGTTSNCNKAWVSLWWNQGEQGPEICFTGNGLVHMTDYCAWITVICFNWNDNASSYSLQGCILYSSAPGEFATDNGYPQNLDTSVSRTPSNFDGQNGRLANDTLSYVIMGC
jgi:hypothetical protein